VHVVLPERLGPGDPNLPSSASVFIKHQQGYDVENLAPNQVRALVANSVSGLSPDKVSITLFPAKTIHSSMVVRWTDVLFFRVQESSAPALRILLGVMSTLCLLGVLAGAYLVKQAGLLDGLEKRARARFGAARRNSGEDDDE
jgi:type III secretion protein J